jgi:ribosomal protein S18 acetylase RimI-like enzyme
MSVSARRTATVCVVSIAPPSTRADATTGRPGFEPTITLTISARLSSTPTVTASKQRVTCRYKTGIKAMSESMVCIRRAEGLDADCVLDLARAFHIEDGHPLAPSAELALLEMLEPGFSEGLILLLVLEGGVCGYGSLSFGYGIEHGGRETFLEDLYVLPALRARGYGGLMCAELENAAREAGCHAMHLEVMPGNRAEQLYRRIGFGDRGSKLLTKPLL